MNRRELITRISNDVGSDKETVADAINAIERSMIDALGQDKTVIVKSFGSFRMRRRTIAHAGIGSSDAPRKEVIVHFTPSKMMVRVDHDAK